MMNWKDLRNHGRDLKLQVQQIEIDDLRLKAAIFEPYIEFKVAEARIECCTKYGDRTAMKHLYNQGLVNVNAGFDNIYHILKDTDWGGLGIDFKNLLLPGLSIIKGVLDSIGGMIEGIKKGLAEINAAGGSFTKSSGQGSGGGHAGFGGQAAGGMMGEGWGWLGEEGPELRYKHGANVEVFSASESRKMVQGAGAAAGGSGASITITGNTFVGTGGMAELGRLITPYLQQESQRRIERT